MDSKDPTLEVTKFATYHVDIPEHDCDLELRLSSGKMVVVQFRPSNADRNYNGSLDIILPENTCVTNWEGDDMQPALAAGPGRLHERIAKQLVLELP